MIAFPVRGILQKYQLAIFKKYPKFKAAQRAITYLNTKR